MVPGPGASTEAFQGVEEVTPLDGVRAEAEISVGLPAVREEMAGHRHRWGCATGEDLALRGEGGLCAASGSAESAVDLTRRLRDTCSRRL